MSDKLKLASINNFDSCTKNLTRGLSHFKLSCNATTLFEPMLSRNDISEVLYNIASILNCHGLNLVYAWPLCYWTTTSQNDMLVGTKIVSEVVYQNSPFHIEQRKCWQFFFLIGINFKSCLLWNFNDLLLVMENLFPLGKLASREITLLFFSLDLTILFY